MWTMGAAVKTVRSMHSLVMIGLQYLGWMYRHCLDICQTYANRAENIVKYGLR